MSWLATNLVAAFFLPPLCFLLLLGLGIAYFYRRPKLARLMLIALFGLLYLGSTPYFAEAALHTLEDRSNALHEPFVNADAIVILGGGSYVHAPEYGHQDTVSDQTLPRIRYGAKLHRATGKPILVSGGKPEDNTLSEAMQMRAVLEQEFQVPVRWTEDDSNNTAENARNSYRILHPLGIQKIYLVTHASHMPRAAESFRLAGFTVIEAPTAFTTRQKIDVMAFIPQAKSLLESKIFIHELIGLLWYRIKSATN
jgi:uncharacterized SAM-binding protein YcdF (DUF218 family)